MAFRVAGFLTCALLVFWNHLPGKANAQTLFNYGPLSGDIDIASDLTRTPTAITLPFNISFLGYSYNKVYITVDGTVGFEKEVLYDDKVNYLVGVRNAERDVPFLAPLLYKGYRPDDMDPGSYQGKIKYRIIDFTKPSDAQREETVTYRQYLTKQLPETLIHYPENLDLKYFVVFTWENVAEGTERGECSLRVPCKSTTFQLALTGDATNTFAIFNYGTYNINVADNYEAGFNAGAGRGWYNVLPCHGGCSTYLHAAAIKNLSEFKGSDIKGRYIFSVGQETVIRGGCLDDSLTSGILEAYPRTVGMFGGEKLEVSGLCGTTSDTIYCRFGTAAAGLNRTVTGAMINSMKGYCPVPKLTMTGRLEVYFSRDGVTWSADNVINVVLPSRLPDTVVVDQAVKEAWYKRDSKQITVKWDPAKFARDPAAKLDIKLIGYRETAQKADYDDLTLLGTTENIKGSFTVDVDLPLHHCSKDCDLYEIGLLEVGLQAQHHRDASQRVAVRFGPIPLGWYVNQDMINRKGSDWSNTKCREWSNADARDSQWLADLLPCPCNLDQAIADFGRFQADPGCSIYAGSRCTYHKGAKHCVRSVVPTNQVGAGNQCCYAADGTLMYSQISHQGSTPDRSHAWGAHPYNQQGKVPELSHWRHDVISFYYCCLWNNYGLCDLYTQRRPTADCRNYDVPAIGFVYGHTHIATFDGLKYNFQSPGDYVLVKHKTFPFILEGKFESRLDSWDIGQLEGKSPWKPKTLIALAMNSGNTKIEVAVTSKGVRDRRGLDIRVGGEPKYFIDQASFWQEFQDFAVINNAQSLTSNRHDNFTILLYNFKVGVNVMAANGLIHVAVAVPPNYRQVDSGKVAQDVQVVGLLGAYDGKEDNDYLPRNGQVVASTSDKKSVLENFALTWGLLTEETGYFRYATSASDKLDIAHTYLDYNDIPYNLQNAPSRADVSQYCGTSDSCKWSYQISGSYNVAVATKNADAWFSVLQKSAYLSDNCGLSDFGANIRVNSNNFSVGRDIQITGCSNGKSLGSAASFRCLKESLEEARSKGRADYGITRKGVSETENYIFHWNPRPYAVCAAGGSSGDSPDLGLIIGVSVGSAVAVIIIIVVVVFIVRKKKKSGETTSVKETRTPATRGKKEVVRDRAAGEAMLSRVEERSPVYKPSAEPVRMSDLHRGSNV